MSPAKTIVDLCKKTNVSMSELARRLGQSPQNLNRKLKSGTLNFDEFQQALDVLGVRFEYSFLLPEGEPTGLLSENERAREKMAVLEAQLELERRNVVFLYGLCRDIRTAMHTISGSADIAAAHVKEPERVEKCLRKIRTAEKQIEALLNDAVDMDRRDRELAGFTAVQDAVQTDAAFVRGKRVLVVEDNEMNREITKDLLEDNGMLVEEAPDGLAAVNRVRERGAAWFQFVLMDIQMPIMNGYEATRAIRKLPGCEQLPIIAVSSNAFEDARARSFDAGMNAYLSKPISVSDLLTSMRRTGK